MDVRGIFQGVHTLNCLLRIGGVGGCPLHWKESEGFPTQVGPTDDEESALEADRWRIVLPPPVVGDEGGQYVIGVHVNNLDA